MKKLITLFFAASTLASVAQKRSLDYTDFSELSLGIPATLYLSQGSKESVTISCDEDIFEDIEFEMRGDRLAIKKEGKWNWNSGWKRSGVTIHVTMKTIEKVAVSGSGNIEGKDVIKASDLDLAVSGSGDLNLEVSCKALDLRISGSGSIGLAGDAVTADARISGSGKVKAEDLTVGALRASISGSGSCYITATEEIKANISGSGSVYYKGDPSKVHSNSSGSGKIRKM